MDNLEINPSEFYYALKDIKQSIDELDDVKEELTSITNMNYDMTSYSTRINVVDIKLNDLYKKMKKIGSEMVKLDPSIATLFKYLNVDNNDEFKFNTDDIDKKEEKIDEVKGNNDGLGAKKSKHSSSILIGNEEKALDTLKGGRKGLGGHVTNKASSLLLKGVRK